MVSFFLEGLSAEELIHGELIGQLIGVFSLVSFWGGAICGGLSKRGRPHRFLRYGFVNECCNLKPGSHIKA